MIDTDKRIIIFGNGGHAKSVISIIEAEAKWRIHGLLVDPGFEIETSVLGHDVLGDRELLTKLVQDNISKGFVAIGDNQFRATVTNDMARQGVEMVTIIHPAAIVMANAEIGAGSMIHAQAVLGVDCRIAQSAIVSATTIVGHDSCIGQYAHLTPGVLIGGGAVVGDYSFLGLGAAVLPNVKIGRNVQVGANTVVHKDLEDNITVVGNPARVIRAKMRGHKN